MTTFFRQDDKTYILRGVNLADGKQPLKQPSYKLESLDSSRAHSVSYLNTPFTSQDAPFHIKRLRYLGFNVIRLPIVWEALEHAGPGIYDEDYMEHIVSFVKLCNQQGIKVIINPHQDLWSRHAGGSGAPLWTLHACGLDPDKFGETHAAVRYAEWPLHSDKKSPKDNPPMMWTTNHNRLASLMVFALFFSGRDFAPKCVIDGVNIQDYLQDKYFAAYAKLAERLGDLAFGYDSMNEPEPGYAGLKDLNKLEREDTAKIGDTPLPIQGMRLGMGQAQTVDNYRLGKTGPHKDGTVDIKPKSGCWLEKEDERWNWTRSESWPLGTCVWALHDVWNVETGALNKPEYFAKTSKEQDVSDSLSWSKTYLKAYHDRWTETIRQYSPKAYIFTQPPVFSPPPEIPKSTPNLLTGYSPHFYDALTMMHKHWHRSWNVDIMNILRGGSKPLSLRLGAGNVRGVIASQLGQLAKEAQGVPTLVGETGIPFNLDDAKAYKDGDYTSQVEALDAILSGADDSLLSVTLWDYSAVSCHEWGDGWNGEDMSIHTQDTPSFPHHEYLRGCRAAAAWCRPFVRSITGPNRLTHMSFDLGTGEFKVEIGGSSEFVAELYIPWLHYRKTDEDGILHLDLHVTDGQVQGDQVDTQIHRWSSTKGGSLVLRRAGGPLSKAQLGTILKSLNNVV